MLVAYSDSDSDAQEAPRAKRRKLEASPSKPRSSNASPPPPPASFHTLYATNVRGAAADDPSLHGGRKRQVAHVEGNWPTHIFLEWTPSKDELSKLEEVVDQCRVKLEDEATAESKIHSLLRSSLHVQLPLHVSLSAPLMLKTDQKDDFVTAVEAAVSTRGARSFSVHPIDVAWVSNLDQTRTFLVLKLSKPENDDLNKLLHACNASADKFDLSLLYESRKEEDRRNARQETKRVEDLTHAFHVSIAWALDHVDKLSKPCLETAFRDELKTVDIHFDVVKLKMGDAVKDLRLVE